MIKNPIPSINLLEPFEGFQFPEIIGWGQAQSKKGSWRYTLNELRRIEKGFWSDERIKENFDKGFWVDWNTLPD